MTTRSPICTVVGHVDHGKSSLLDFIRGTRIVSKEAGGITQAIGASIIPIESIKKTAGALSNQMQFSIPGLLFIDTPGHAAFTGMRKRGGSLADIASVAVDINEGCKPQTLEAIEILKDSKTPFVVAANKLDLVKGFRNAKVPLMQLLSQQSAEVIQDIETKMYTLVGAFHELGFASERFDRVSDYTKEIAIVPTSATTGYGVPEMLMVLAGLAQKFLEKNLAVNVDGAALGTVLEVVEHKGLGTTVDTIIFDGTLRPGDDIVIGSLGEPIVTKIRALLQPVKVADMRDRTAKFVPVKQAVAATGVKIAAPMLEGVIAGMPLRAAGDDVEAAKREVQQDVADVLIETEKEGIILKADTLGSIEALIHLCKVNDIAIRKASIGAITKKDILDAESNFDVDPAYSCVLGFNVPSQIEAHEKVHIITSAVIYELIDLYKEWKEKLLRVLQEKQAANLQKPAKIVFLDGCGFRQSNPAVIGVEVMSGVLRKNVELIKADGSVVGSVKAIQHNKKDISEAEIDMQVAVSIPGSTVGRQLLEKDVYYTNMDEQHFRKLKEIRKQLSPKEVDLLKEIAEIKRRDSPLWGV